MLKSITNGISAKYLSEPFGKTYAPVQMVLADKVPCTKAEWDEEQRKMERFLEALYFDD